MNEKNDAMKEDICVFPLFTHTASVSWFFLVMTTWLICCCQSELGTC